MAKAKTASKAEKKATGTAVAVPAPRTGSALALPAGLSIVRAVTFQLRKWPADAPPILATFISAFKKKKPLKGDRRQQVDPETGEISTGAVKEPPVVAEIIEYGNRGTAEKPVWVKEPIRELIVPAVLRGILEDEYGELQEDGQPFFVGRTFFMQTYPKQSGKQYRTFDVTEVNAPDTAKAAE